MLTRRGLFKLLTGAVVSPVLKPLVCLIPEERPPVDIWKHVPAPEYRTYLVGADAIMVGGALTAADIRRCVASLKGANVRPLYDNTYHCYVHPSHQKYMSEEFDEMFT